MYTKLKNNIPSLKYKLKVQDDGMIIVKKYPENEIVFNGNSEHFDRTRIKREYENIYQMISVYNVSFKKMKYY